MSATQTQSPPATESNPRKTAPDRLSPSPGAQRRQEEEIPNKEKEEDDDATKTSSSSDIVNQNEVDPTFAPINAPVKTNEDNQLQASRSIERSWSLNDGYSVHTGDEQSGEKADEEAGVTGDGEPPEFVVGWDENDPMNPRNMNTGRRWLIVIICSLGSLCVYVLMVWFGSTC